MSLLEQLKNNKGTVSSALGKSLAEQVLKENNKILIEAVKLITFNDKNVRASAAKIFEMVAEKKPELVKEYLENLLPCLGVQEAQTRWMIIRTLGLCSKLNPEIAIKAISNAQKFLEDKNAGACLWNRTIFYLGCVGTLSEKNAQQTFSILEKALKEIPNQEDTILDAFIKIIKTANSEIKSEIIKRTKEYANHLKISIRTKVNKILKLSNA